MAARVTQYVVEGAVSVATAIAITEGLLYGVDSAGTAILADCHTGPVHALGFAIKGLTLAQAGVRTVAGLARIGIIQLSTTEITGTWTIGQEVYLEQTGKWTTVFPAVNGDTIQAVGIAIGTNKVAAYVMPPIAKLQAAGNSTLGAVL